MNATAHRSQQPVVTDRQSGARSHCAHEHRPAGSRGPADLTFHVSRCTASASVTSPEPAHGASPPAFTLIEILVTVALLSFIILGLLAMFGQTQRAFVNSMTQTDVLESGRIIMDMVTREMEQMSPSHSPYTTNFTVEISPNFSDPAVFPLLQGMPGTTYPGNPTRQECRTNIMQRFFFLMRTNQSWLGIGYFVIQDAGPHVGSLYRYVSDPYLKYNVSLLYSNYMVAFNTANQNSLRGLPIPNVIPGVGSLGRIADGIIHFRVRPFATNGFPLIAISDAPVLGQARFLKAPPFNGNYSYVLLTNILASWESLLPDQPKCVFFSNAIPASLDLELGIMEPRTIERYRSFGVGNNVAQRNYLSNHVAQVHLFRQRILVRDYDFQAYQ